MSTHLENGYRLPATGDIFALANEARRLANPVRDRLDVQALVDGASSLIDKWALDVFALADVEAMPATRAFHPLDEARARFNRRLDEHEPWEKLSSPHRFELSISRDPATGAFGVYAHYEDDAYWRVLEELGHTMGLEWFGYWNHTDRPDSLSDDQWDQRQEFWDRTLAGGTYGGTGLSMRLRDYDQIMPRTQDLVTSLGVKPRSRTERAVRVAVDLACRWIPIGASVSDIVRAVSPAELSPEFLAATTKALPELRTPTLHKRYNLNDCGSVPPELDAFARAHVVTQIGVARDHR